MQTTGRTILLGIIALLSLGGCAHSLVYSEVRDKQAQEAKRAAGELKMAEKVRLLEARYNEVAALEIESARSLAETLRNKELARVARSTVLRDPDPQKKQRNGLVDVLETRLEKLGAKRRTADLPASATRNCGVLDCNSLLAIQSTRAEAKELRDTFELSRAEFRSIFGYDFRNCADVEAAVGSRKAFVKRLTDVQRAGVKPGSNLDALASTCAELAKKYKDFDSAIAGGDLPKVLDEAREADIKIAKYRADLVLAEAKLATAVEAFAEAEKNATPEQRNSLGSLEARANDLKAIIGTVITVSDALSVPGAHATTKEVVNQLTVVLGALAGQKPDTEELDPDQQAAVAFVRALPELADEADKLLKEAGQARIVPFAIAREHYRLALQGYENALAIEVSRAAALRARADAMTQELVALARAHQLLTQDRRQWETQSLTTLNAMQATKERREFYEALATYWDEVFFYRAEEQIWKARAQALQFGASLAVSEAAALQWDNLIGGVATVLADYHASGVKPAEIAEFLKAFGFIYIGARVGQ